MSLARVVNFVEPKHFDYRVAGLGDYLATLVSEPDVSTRNKMAIELLDFLYPSKTAQLLIRAPEPITETLGNWKPDGPNQPEPSAA